MQTDHSMDRERNAANAGQAGLVAALVMVTVQLIWRLNWSKDGVVQAFPEFVVAAVARLTPLSVFGAATENYGSLAKKSLFAATLLVIVAVGFRVGDVAGWIANRIGRGFTGRALAGLLVAGALLLTTMLVILPIAHLGAFARDSSYTSDILTQLFVTFGLYAVVWALLSSPSLSQSQVEVTEDAMIDRRSLLSRAGWGLGTLAAFVAAAGAGWRVVSPRTSRASVGADQPTTNDIVATQRARQAAPQTPTPRDEAALASDIALQEAPDPFTLFAELDANGAISPVLTEVDDFYHVSKNLIDPSVSQDGWKLKVTGMVNTPLELTYDDVVGRGTLEKITTLSCISNELNGDLTGTALWTGFPLMDLLNAAGVQEGAVDVIFKAADDYEDSIKIERAMDPDTIVVVSMNGAPLEDDHGFPARMIVPGIYGMKNVKWLQEIEIVGEDFQGYWQTRGWSDSAENQIWGRIDSPSGKIDAGPYVAAGLASAGDRDISRVEVSLDDGGTWADAILEPSLNPPFTWVRWAFPFEAAEGEYTMRIRATDGTGQVMLQDERSPLPDGATGWPRRKFKVNG